MPLPFLPSTWVQLLFGLRDPLGAATLPGPGPSLPVLSPPCPVHLRASPGGTVCGPQPHPSSCLGDRDVPDLLCPRFGQHVVCSSLGLSPPLLLRAVGRVHDLVDGRAQGTWGSPYGARAEPHWGHSWCLGAAPGPALCRASKPGFAETMPREHAWCTASVCAWPDLYLSRGCACPRVALCAVLASAHEQSVLMQPFASLPGPVLVSLRPGSEQLCPQQLLPERPPSVNQREDLAVRDGQRPFSVQEETVPRCAAEHRLEEKKTRLANGFDIFECPPPKTENEVGRRGGVGAVPGWRVENRGVRITTCCVPWPGRLTHFVNSFNRQAMSTI